MSKVGKAVDRSNIRGSSKDRLKSLVSSHGWSWFGKLENTEDRKGDGTSGGVSFTILEASLEDKFSTVYDDVDSDEVLEDLVTEFDFVYDEDEEDEDNLYEVEGLWRSLRVDYFRSVENLNTKIARQRVKDELSK